MVYNKYMKKFLLFISSGLLVAGLASLLILSPAEAQVGSGGAVGGIDAARGAGVPSILAMGDGSIISKGINIMLYAIGVISVVMLIVGGFRYVVSGGQKEAVTAAKNTILYAIIGLLVAIFAYPFIKFIVDVVLGMSGGTDV